MKRKKLQLHRDTVRTLDAQSFEDAAGGTVITCLRTCFCSVVSCFPVCTLQISQCVQASCDCQASG